jgi:hypothetical protein
MLKNELITRKAFLARVANDRELDLALEKKGFSLSDKHESMRRVELEYPAQTQFELLTWVTIFCSILTRLRTEHMWFMLGVLG